MNGTNGNQSGFDEAHRGHYGLVPRIQTAHGKMARWRQEQ